LPGALVWCAWPCITALCVAFALLAGAFLPLLQHVNLAKTGFSIVERLEKELEPLVNRADAAPALANSKIARRALMPQIEVKICKITANVLLASETGSVNNACEQRMHWKWKLRHTCCLNVLCAGLLTISRFEWQGSLWISNR